MQKPTKTFYESIDKLSEEMAREHLKHCSSDIEDELKKHQEQSTNNLNQVTENENKPPIQKTEDETFNPDKPILHKLQNESPSEKSPPTKNPPLTNNINNNFSTTSTTINAANENKQIEFLIRPTDTETDDDDNYYFASNVFKKSRNKHNYQKSFYEKSQMREQTRISNIEALKRKYTARELTRNLSCPIINAKSQSIMQKVENRVPIWEKAIDLQNEKQAKIMINEKRKLQFEENQICKTKRKMSQNDINRFIKSQFEWKEQIEIKKKNLQILSRVKSQNDLMSNAKYVVYINKTSKNIIEKKRKDKKMNSHNSDISERLYKEQEEKKKKLLLLQKKYTPSFMPSINQYTQRTRNKTKLIKSKSFFTMGIIDNDSSNNKKKRDSSTNSKNKSRGPSRANSKIQPKIFSKPKSKNFSMNDVSSRSINRNSKDGSEISEFDKPPLIPQKSNKELSPSISLAKSQTPEVNNDKNSSNNIINNIPQTKTQVIIAQEQIAEAPPVKKEINEPKKTQNINEIKPKKPSLLINLDSDRNINMNDEDIDNENIQNSIYPYSFKPKNTNEQITTINKRNNANEDSFEPSWANELQMLSNIPEKKNKDNSPINSLYMINTRNASSTGVNVPITVMGNGPFSRFFKKKIV